MKKEFTKKTEIHTKIREAFNSGMDINDLNTVYKFLDKISDEYELKPETLAYVVQSINRYALSNEFKKTNNKQTYPKINLIDVVECCKRYGYENIYDNIRYNLIEKIDKRKANKTSSLGDFSGYFFRLQKAANLNNKLEEFENDEKFSYLKKYSKSKLIYQFDELHDLYWQDSNIDKFIKNSGIEFDPIIKETLNTIRQNPKVTFSKKATLNTFLKFKEKLEAFVNNYKQLNGE